MIYSDLTLHLLEADVLNELHVVTMDEFLNISSDPFLVSPDEATDMGVI